MSRRVAAEVYGPHWNGPRMGAQTPGAMFRLLPLGLLEQFRIMRAERFGPNDDDTTLDELRLYRWLFAFTLLNAGRVE